VALGFFWYPYGVMTKGVPPRTWNLSVSPRDGAAYRRTSSSHNFLATASVEFVGIAA
jgi:hypothetical protein